MEVPLRLIAIDPNTGGENCPALIVDERNGDLLFQGEEETDPQVRAGVDGLSKIGSTEVIGRIPARMRSQVLAALLELEAKDGGQPVVP